MREPTNEQIKKFWEWCGFKYTRVDDIPWHKKPEDYQTNYWFANNHWTYPDGSKHKEFPAIDLNNLFTYAVPKLNEGGYGCSVALDGAGGHACTYVPFAPSGDNVYSSNDNSNPALALFWAIWEVIK